MQRTGYKNIQASTMLILLLHLSLHTVDEGLAINPSCTCVRFTSTYGKERGTFSSPEYPRAYPPRLDCLLYTFLAQPHEIVELVFTDFDIYKEQLDCTRGDYLKVYSEGGTHGPGPPGVNQYSAWSRVLCGNRADAPPALYSHGPLLVLEFHTERASNATGFVGTYRFIDRRNFETDGVQIEDSCDYVFSSQPSRPSHGRLYSPRYPSSYPTNVRCTYQFNGRAHEKIKLIFEESFLQKGDESCLNRADIIKVFDGRTSSAPVLAMLCNEVVGYEILSTGPDLFIQFTSNSNTPGQGFKASYQFQLDDTISDAEGNKKSSTTEAISGLGPAVSAATSTCNQVFRSDKGKSGRFSSPLHPSPYPQKTQCHYDFLARGRERIRLVFEDFSLQRISENVIDCESMDSLDVFVYVDGRLEKMASYCGSERPKPIMSNGPKLSIEFRGLYSSRHSRGFKISYSFVEDYSIPTGSQLPDFPCAFVYNSTERSRGIVTSPNYPGLYPRDTECNYFFYGDENQRVHLTFTHFDVEGVMPCEAVSASDYVQFFSQMISTSQRHCGQLEELMVTSEKNFLRVTFRSNDRLDGTGFRAEYIFLRESEMHSITMPDDENDYSIPTGSQLPDFPCAFVYNSTERSRGIVTSPNYPGLYPRDTECNYFFYGDENQRVHLTFTHFDVEGVMPCEAVSASDYVQFFSQMISTSQRHCGQLEELMVTSEKNFLRVTFRSNDRLDGTGFRAEYIFLRESEMHSITMPDDENGSTYHAPHLIIPYFVLLTSIFN